MRDPIRPTIWTAERVKALRVSFGLTQHQFAERLGCSTQAVSFWERGTRTPTGLYARELGRLVEASDGISRRSVPPSGR